MINYMKAKVVFATETSDKVTCLDFPVIPRTGETIKVNNFFGKSAYDEIKKSALCWSGERGVIQSVEYSKNEDGFYVEMYVWCED